jgi:hypothetical protein
LLQTLKGTDFENNIPYMYLDSEGNVTVGVGHKLATHDDATKLSFKINSETDPETKTMPRRKRHAVIGGDRGPDLAKDRQAGYMATDAEIINDFDFLTGHEGLKKYFPPNLRPYTTLVLDDDDVDDLFID